MNQSDKVEEILESLHDHIEGQKRKLDEENRELLEKGKMRFEEAVSAETLLGVGLRNKNRALGTNDRLRLLLERVRTMRPGKLLARARRTHPLKTVDQTLHGRSGILGAMGWMFGLSLILTLSLSWVPVVGPFLGPIVGGYFGGRRAGTAPRALLAALLPALLLSLVIVAIGALAASMADRWSIGAAGIVFAGALGVILIVHNLILFAAAFVGGLVRQLEGN
jgi:hypothetical protein